MKAAHSPQPQGKEALLLLISGAVDLRHNYKNAAAVNDQMNRLLGVAGEAT
ncbi:MAG: hypothetical protein ABIY37_17520 [Devosia sp.]